MASEHVKACHRRGEIVTAVVVWLLLGAIVNIAVAWALALCFNFSARSEIGQPTDPLVLRVFPNLGSMPHGSIHCGRRERLGLVYEDVVPKIERWYAHLRSGFPVLAFEGAQYIESPPVTGTRLAGWPFVITRPHGQAVQRRAVPLRPLWPGFAINTILYAAILWLLFTFPGAIRRRRRIKRGRCPRCAYDLRGSDPSACPECGAALTPKTVES
jgi:hypothetical protein